jgi:hypothetical protein
MEYIEREMEKNMVSRNTLIYRWKSEWGAHAEGIGRDGCRLVAWNLSLCRQHWCTHRAGQNSVSNEVDAVNVASTRKHHW